NTFHQIGSALGLALLVALGSVFAPSGTDVESLLHRVNVALVGSSLLLALALVVVLTLVARPGQATPSSKKIGRSSR
ncbi:MAG TPA: MFS transporter, partial [Spirochaetia bacterium]|nr:MFS transporter [Spirochaetia bacterium]